VLTNQLHKGTRKGKRAFVTCRHRSERVRRIRQNLSRRNLFSLV